MTSPRDDAPASKIAEIVAAILAKYARQERILSGTDLARAGMTSIDMVELMFAIEAEFDLVIPPQDITAENFHSVGTIERLVGRLREAAGSGAAAA